VKDEKEMLKERDQALECFRFLNGDANTDEMDLEKLRNRMKTYDKKYENSLDDFMNELEHSQHVEGRNLNFKEFVTDMYKPYTRDK